MSNLEPLLSSDLLFSQQSRISRGLTLLLLSLMNQISSSSFLSTRLRIHQLSRPLRTRRSTLEDTFEKSMFWTSKNWRNTSTWKSRQIARRFTKSGAPDHMEFCSTTSQPTSSSKSLAQEIWMESSWIQLEIWWSTCCLSRMAFLFLHQKLIWKMKSWLMTWC